MCCHLMMPRRGFPPGWSRNGKTLSCQHALRIELCDNMLQGALFCIFWTATPRILKAKFWEVHLRNNKNLQMSSIYTHEYLSLLSETRELLWSYLGVVSLLPGSHSSSEGTLDRTEWAVRLQLPGRHATSRLHHRAASFLLNLGSGSPKA